MKVQLSIAAAIVAASLAIVDAQYAQYGQYEMEDMGEQPQGAYNGNGAPDMGGPGGPPGPDPWQAVPDQYDGPNPNAEMRSGDMNDGAENMQYAAGPGPFQQPNQQMPPNMYANQAPDQRGVDAYQQPGSIPAPGANGNANWNQPQQRQPDQNGGGYGNWDRLTPQPQQGQPNQNGGYGDWNQLTPQPQGQPNQNDGNPPQPVPTQAPTPAPQPNPAPQPVPSQAPNPAPQPNPAPGPAPKPTPNPAPKPTKTPSVTPAGTVPSKPKEPKSTHSKSTSFKQFQNDDGVGTIGGKNLPSDEDDQQSVKQVAFKASAPEESAKKEEGGIGALGIAASAVGCVLGVAVMAYVYKKRAMEPKTPGTPKEGEATLFHVRRQLTPPPV